jgi:hypothetical protein
MPNDVRLTVGELDEIDKRLDEIDFMMNYLELPDDVLDTLERELHMHVTTIEQSLKAGKRAHLRSVK